MIHRIGKHGIAKQLDLTEGSIADQMQSIPGLFGFQQHTWAHGSVHDINANKSILWGNRVISGQYKGQWLLPDAKGNPIPFHTLDDVIAHKGTQGAFKQTAVKAWTASGGMRALGPLLIGYSAFQEAKVGYREGGVWGGIKGAGKSVATDVAMGWALGTVLKHPALLGLAIAPASVAAIVANREYGNQYLRRHKGDSLSGSMYGASRSAVMNSQMAATMRQRAVMSMESSRFNAMRSLGNEASFYHMSKSVYGSDRYSAMPVPNMAY